MGILKKNITARILFLLVFVLIFFFLVSKPSMAQDAFSSPSQIPNFQTTPTLVVLTPAKNIEGLAPAPPTPISTTGALDWVKAHIADWILTLLLRPLANLIEIGQFVTSEMMDVRLPVVVNANNTALVNDLTNNYVVTVGNTFVPAAQQPVPGKIIFDQFMMGGGRNYGFNLGIIGTIPMMFAGFRTLYPAYVLWLYFLNFANILSLVALVVIGFAVMFQYKINAYHMKKILPRFLAAIILVQYSWVICQFLFDVNSLFALSIKNMTRQITVTQYELDISSGSFVSIPHQVNVADLVENGLSGIIDEFKEAYQGGAGVGAIARTGIWVILGVAQGLPVLIPFLLAGIGGIITFAFVAFVRFLMLYLFVIISPLALMTYAIPELGKTATTWAKTLFLTLLMWPVTLIMFSLLYIFAVAL